MTPITLDRWALLDEIHATLIPAVNAEVAPAQIRKVIYEHEPDAYRFLCSWGTFRFEFGVTPEFIAQAIAPEQSIIAQVRQACDNAIRSLTQSLVDQRLGQLCQTVEKLNGALQQLQDLVLMQQTTLAALQRPWYSRFWRRIRGPS